MILYSNTTLVKVKFRSADMIYYFKQNSNTTLVKVKWLYSYYPILSFYSNTTLVKVKYNYQDEY